MTGKNSGGGSKVCEIDGCRGKVSNAVRQNPKSENLCAVHQYYEMKASRQNIKCGIIGCTRIALAGGLCKSHNPAKYGVRGDMLSEVAEERLAHLKKILGAVGAKIPARVRHIHEVDVNDLRCLYCHKEVKSSHETLAPHACFDCALRIRKLTNQ